MGLDIRVRFPTEATPAWEAIRDQLARVGENPQIRMIDNLPAFPDEIPEGDWKELRLGIAAGMVTVRRSPGVLACVIWGNADPALTATWQKVAWACAAAGDGVVEAATGPQRADDFAAMVGLSPS